MSIKYKWLAGKLKEMIEKYRKAGIEKLPTEHELCSRYHVSRQTVRQALSLLENSRLIVRKQGSGSYITGLSSDPSRNTVAVLISDDQEYIYPGVLSDIRTELDENGFSSLGLSQGIPRQDLGVGATGADAREVGLEGVEALAHVLLGAVGVLAHV